MDQGVYSEVGRLQRVLVHRPGGEISRMTQFELEELLFDDILSPEVAGSEHDVLCEILASEGAEVLQVTDLLRAALVRAPAEATADLLDRVCHLSAVPEIAEWIAAWPADRLAKALIQGIFWKELLDAPVSLARLHAQSKGDHHMALLPVPNLMFMRDPCISVYDGVLVGGMATQARAREPEIVRFALEHGVATPPAILFDTRDARNPALRALEGGDLLVIGPGVLLVGVSERTTPQTLQRVAETVLFPRFPHLERVYAVMMPAKRSVMHLDTVLTQLDRRLFVGHAPMIQRGEGITIAELARSKRPRVLDNCTVQDLLRQVIGADVAVVPCGGDDPLMQQREQWTDGANAVCLGPGRVILYSRNVHTLRMLEDQHGFAPVNLAGWDPAEARLEALRSAQQHERVAYTFVGSELSRARGGARCLTMPLKRARL